MVLSAKQFRIGGENAPLHSIASSNGAVSNSKHKENNLNPKFFKFQYGFVSCWTLLKIVLSSLLSKFVFILSVVVVVVVAHKEMKKSKIDSTLKSRSCTRMREGTFWAVTA